MSRHTPGPWHNNQKADGTERRVIHNSVGKLIAVVPHAGDARLIAKAPEMLEALYIAAKVLRRISNAAGKTPFWAKDGDGYAASAMIHALLQESD